jgi:hypothetical protein
MKKSLLLAAALTAAVPAFAQVQITEWMYSGNGAEFVEFTNLGASAVSFAGWVYDDNSRLTSAAAGAFDLSGFGLVGAGESVVITEGDASLFRTNWGLSASVKVLGNYTNNLGRADEINLFDGAGNLVDRLTYGDQTFAGTVRTQYSSGTPVSIAALGPQSVMPGNWVLSVTGDAYGSAMNREFDVGNPGQFILAAVPEPETYAMLLAGLGVIGAIARRRRTK